MFGICFSYLYDNILRLPRRAFDLQLEVHIALILICSIVYGLHEVIRMVTFQLLGASWKYGGRTNNLTEAKKHLVPVLTIMVWSPNHPFSLGQYLIVLLGPVVILTFVAMTGMLLFVQIPVIVTWLMVMGIVHSVFVVPDIWLMLIVLWFGLNTYLVDEQSGLSIYAP